MSGGQSGLYSEFQAILGCRVETLSLKERKRERETEREEVKDKEGDKKGEGGRDVRREK